MSNTSQFKTAYNDYSGYAAQRKQQKPEIACLHTYSMATCC